MAPRPTSFALALVLLSPAAAVVSARTESAAQTGPRTPLDQMKAQLATPTLAPNATVTIDLKATPVRDIVDAMAKAAGITVRYHSGATNLSVPADMELLDANIYDALQALLAARTLGLTFKVTGPRSVFVYPNTPENRQKYADSVRTFAVVNAEVGAMTQILNRALMEPNLLGADDLRPVIVSDSASRTLAVRATADTMAKVAKIIADNDKR